MSTPLPTHRAIPPAARLKAWRERQAITQATAAQRLQVSLYTYRRWEQGVSEGPHLARILRDYGI